MNVITISVEILLINYATAIIHSTTKFIITRERKIYYTHKFIIKKIRKMMNCRKKRQIT